MPASLTRAAAVFRMGLVMQQELVRGEDLAVAHRWSCRNATHYRCRRRLRGGYGIRRRGRLHEGGLGDDGGEPVDGHRATDRLRDVRRGWGRGRRLVENKA